MRASQIQAAALLLLSIGVHCFIRTASASPIRVRDSAICAGDMSFEPDFFPDDQISSAITGCGDEITPCAPVPGPTTKKYYCPLDVAHGVLAWGYEVTYPENPGANDSALLDCVAQVFKCPPGLTDADIQRAINNFLIGFAAVIAGLVLLGACAATYSRCKAKHSDTAALRQRLLPPPSSTGAGDSAESSRDEADEGTDTAVAAVVVVARAAVGGDC